MSYDLYFYKRKENKLTEQEFANYLTKTIRFNNSEFERQWDYENPETGVYFLIDWNDPSTEQEEIEIWDSFAEFDNTNFSCSINFFRPQYFGLEVFPIIERIADELDLYILNPQNFDEVEMPKKFPKQYLEAQWTEHNDQISEEHFNEMSFNFMSPEKSNGMWWFNLHRTELQESLIEDIFVPGLFAIKSNDDEQLYTACVWPEHIPIILPQVDYVIIKKKYKKLFKIVEEDGLVPYANIINKLGVFFEEFSYAGQNLKVLRQNNADKMTAEFNALKIISSVKDFGSGVKLDKFVNVKPD
ncbi:MAG: hypothetical protein JST32_08110 [Bacteroidetes bacterium]|nr:hypothetical protein [Bacteroidota bacterium]